ncbi:MAG: hypothetical protein EOP00_18585 [Pedobacter sp.]|nr:MAG: hypothetical protein EOP00_18585 [Pedobacter sp.]
MIEGTDFYFNEDGLMVFTAAYHLKRGKCCKNKCKHCPWNYGKAERQKSSFLSNDKPNGKTTNRS